MTKFDLFIHLIEQPVLESKTRFIYMETNQTNYQSTNLEAPTF